MTRLSIWATRYVPTRRLAALASIAAPAWLLSGSETGAALAAGIVLALLAAAIVDALATPGERQVTVERAVPGSIGIGDPGTVEYRVHARWPLRLRFTLYDVLPTALERRGSPAADGVVSPGSAVVLRVDVVGRVRGQFALGSIVARVSGPLGLVHRTLRYAPTDAVAVTPSVTGIRRYRLLALQHRLRDAGIRAIRRRGEGTTFAGLRDYVEGDDPRHVDWKATARRRKLIAREFTVEQGQIVLIVIDAGRMMTQLDGPLPRFEYALSSATVLADVAAQSGDRVGVLVFDDAIRAFVPPQRGGKGAMALQRIREALIPVVAKMVEPDYAAAFRMLATRLRKRSLIVIFTDVIDPRSSGAVIAHTVRSAVRHLPVVVALRNEELLAAAVPSSADAAGRVFERAAAEELVQARADALLRMRRAGVSVLDVSPRAMTAAVVNRYLEIKSRSAL